MSAVRDKHTSVDADLQRLYNEVWAGFADEAPAASPKKQRVPPAVKVIDHSDDVTLSGQPAASSAYGVPPSSYNQYQGTRNLMQVL